MINNINSNLNYNYINNTNNLNSKKNTQINNLNNTKELKLNNTSAKETNLNNNNIGNNKINNNINTPLNNNNILNPIQNNTSNSVSDKSEATNKILGYGVDKDGFFTSDFNEAAGIPKDYKIYAKDVEKYANFIGKGNSLNDILFKNIDFAKTIGNAYKLFSQLISSENIYFNKENIESIPKWFQYDSRNFQIIKTYGSENELMNIQKSKNDQFKVEVSLEFDFKNKENLDKGEALLTFFEAMNSKKLYGNYGVIEGSTTILGKLGGLDRNMSLDEIKDLNDFLSKHPINHTNNNEIMREVLLLPMKIDNIEDFKKEWLKLEAKNEQSLEKQETNQNIGSKKILNSMQDLDKDNKEKENKLKPIKGKSQNKETYQNKDTNDLLKKLLENKFNLSKELEILLGVKIDDKDLSNNDFTKIFSKLNLHNIKSVDLKA